MEKGVIPRIRKELAENIDPKTKDSAKNYFKEEIKVYGIKTAVVTNIAKRYFNELKGKDKKEIFSLCEELLKSGYMEESFIAYNWAYWLHKQYEEKDFRIFENWVDTYVSNWAECDTLCNHAVGTFIEKYPAYVEELKKWTKSKNRWARRASAVSLILPTRRGMFLREVFEISDALMTDQDDLVQKGFGWLLKEAGKAHQKEVFNYVMKNKKAMPRTALRYAIEKFPADLRAKAMEK